MEVVERTGELDGLPVRWLERAGGGTTTLYLHDVPLGADSLAPFLAAERGPAVAVDLPGFGLSGKPGRLPYDLAFYVDWIERFGDWLELDRYNLVAHGTGAIGLLAALRAPERLVRGALIAPLPLGIEFRWHRLARAWRRPVIGQLTMGFAEAKTFKRLLPAELALPAWEQFDQGTQRAILRFHRSAGERELLAAGAPLHNIAAPMLIVSGSSDPYFVADCTDAYGENMPQATIERVSLAGHWPWLDRAELVARVIAFLRD